MQAELSKALGEIFGALLFRERCRRNRTDAYLFFGYCLGVGFENCKARSTSGKVASCRIVCGWAILSEDAKVTPIPKSHVLRARRAPLWPARKFG